MGAWLHERCHRSGTRSLPAARKAITALPSDLPEIRLYQQIKVNSYSIRLQGWQRNDLVRPFNMYDWNCIGGICQA
jgi:hypothetical protein